MIHCWRLIGWHLGILDEFNICTSEEKLQSYFDDYMRWTPHRLKTCRSSTHKLQFATCHSFGRYTGVGEQLFFGLVTSLEHSRGISVPYSKIKSYPYMRKFVRLNFITTMTNLVHCPFININIVDWRSKSCCCSSGILHSWYCAWIGPSVSCAIDGKKILKDLVGRSIMLRSRSLYLWTTVSGLL